MSGRRIDAMVIGASAGGVEALSAILPEVPASYRGAVFVVLHLPKGRPSLLAELLRPRCALAVVEPEDKDPVVPGTIYLAPPDYHLLIDDGPTIALSTDPPVNYSRPSIDVTFESAAETYGPRLLGLVLTGASHDGAAGLAAVHRHGGITCVQDPATAASPLMIEAAIRSTPAAQILSIPAIGELLRRTASAGTPVEETAS